MRRSVSRETAVVGVLLLLATAGCGGSSGGGTNASGSAPSAKPRLLWSAPPDPIGRTVAAGLTPEVKESLTYHVHAHLDVFVNGKPIVVPAGIGINIDDPGVHKFNDGPDGSASYGGIEGCDQPCISPLHTHDTSGIVHTESSTPEPNTLGEFFTEWGVRLSRSCVEDFCNPKPVAFYVDGKRYAQDPTAIELTDHKEIAVVIGVAPPVIPDTADFSKA